MIVRILGEGQLDVPDTAIDELNELDDALQAAVDGGDEVAYRDALAALLDRVRAAGTPLIEDALLPSELVLPNEDAEMEQVRAMLQDDGLIPG